MSALGSVQLSGLRRLIRLLQHLERRIERIAELGGAREAAPEPNDWPQYSLNTPVSQRNQRLERQFGHNQPAVAHPVADRNVEGDDGRAVHAEDGGFVGIADSTLPESSHEPSTLDARCAQSDWGQRYAQSAEPDGRAQNNIIRGRA